MIDPNKFAQLTKKSARSFAEQKSLIKKLMAGKVVNCQYCNQPLLLSLPNEQQSAAMIACVSGCTDICLDTV